MTTAEPGTQRNPDILNPADLDLSGLRAHCRQDHKAPHYPRSNLDLSGWHAREHHRRGLLGHVHRDPPWVLVRNRHTGLTVGQISRPVGYYTGQGAITRAELNAEIRARLSTRTQETAR